MMNTSSWGLDAFTSASDAAFTLARLSRMLPLLSMTMPIETGTSGWVNALIGCSTPFSKTLNAVCGMPEIGLPFLSAHADVQIHLTRVDGEGGHLVLRQRLCPHPGSRGKYQRQQGPFCMNSPNSAHHLMKTLPVLADESGDA